jgi:hypothetical protein
MTSFAGSPIPDHVLSKSQAEDLLEPHRARLDQCIQHGWIAWTQDYAHKHHILSPRARAIIIFDEIAAKAKELFSIPGVVFAPKNNSFLLFIGDNIIIRFKKIGKNGRCSNIKTHQQTLFQAQQMVIPGLEPPTAMTAGYVLDDLQLNIARKLVVCQFDNEVLWTIELLGESGAGAQVVSMTPPQPPASPKTHFKPKDETISLPKKKKNEK